MFQPCKSLSNEFRAKYYNFDNRLDMEQNLMKIEHIQSMKQGNPIDIENELKEIRDGTPYRAYIKNFLIS